MNIYGLVNMTIVRCILYTLLYMYNNVLKDAYTVVLGLDCLSDPLCMFVGFLLVARISYLN